MSPFSALQYQTLFLRLAHIKAIASISFEVVFAEHLPDGSTISVTASSNSGAYWMGTVVLLADIVSTAFAVRYVDVDMHAAVRFIPGVFLGFLPPDFRAAVL